MTNMSRNVIKATKSDADFYSSVLNRCESVRLECANDDKLDD
jgi:hypothetical protein